MSTNITHKTIGNSLAVIIFAYYSLILIIMGTLLNTLTLFILCHATFARAKQRPTLYYMRIIAIFDILMLYGWNLQIYLQIIHGFRLDTRSVIWCKMTSFHTYFSAQSSAWLRVFVCLDRYLALSYRHRTWFGNSTNVLILILICLTVFTLINFHFFPFACFVNADGSINLNSQSYAIYPIWDYVNLTLYNVVPSVFMGGFNSCVITKLVVLRRTNSVQTSAIRHRSMSVALVVTTCLFTMMTTPASVAFAFFSKTAPSYVLKMLDCILTTYHVLSFPIYFITLKDFRRQTISLANSRCLCNRIVPYSVGNDLRTERKTEVS